MGRLARLSSFFSSTVLFPSSPSLLPRLSVCSFSFWSVQLHLNNPGAVPPSPTRELSPGNRQGTQHAVGIRGACVCQRDKGREAWGLACSPYLQHCLKSSRKTQICLSLVRLNEELLGGKRGVTSLFQRSRARAGQHVSCAVSFF